MLSYETRFWSSSPTARLAGVDEAGRGPLAGPVVAGAVLMSPEIAKGLREGLLACLNDSKQLSGGQRDEYLGILSCTDGVEIGIGIADNTEIDGINILRATHLAMKRAVENLPHGVPTHALVDGLPVRGLPCGSTAIVKGDSKSFLIAAASVAAKTTRDRIMCEMDLLYPEYGFAKHKGYPTPEHLEACLLYGSCPIHRHSYAPVAALDQPSLF